MAVGVQAPSRLGRYELLARLAAGGMGEIFLARLEGAAGFEKLYVVKRILPHLADDARFRAMLIAEARIASKLSHANICQVYELGEADGQLYIVMEYLEGITVLPMLRKASRQAAPLELGLIAGVLQQASDALHHAHELRDRDGEPLGIVHRDVTPSNIFITDGGVAKVLDFGIAKVKDASAKTQTGTVKGKYAYMAPEQLRGASIDRRADVFALGVVAFEMLALRRLFQRKTDYLTFRAVIEQPIPALRRYRPDVPDELAVQVARALEREPDQRFATARLFASAIIDAIAPVRPWTQGEIADFVRVHFADDIARRGEEVAAAIGRTRSGRLRTSVPVLEAQPEVPEDGQDDAEFPPVEEVEGTISDPAPAPAGLDRELPADGQTPPPFGAESSASGHQVQPLIAPAAPAPRRGVFWPLLATAMVAITGVALYLVWQQTRRPAPVVNITSEPAEPPIARAPEPEPAPAPPPPEPPPPEPPPPDRGSAAESATVRTSKPRLSRSRSPRRSPYSDAVRARAAQINRCAREHGRPPPSARVVIIVATSGRAKRVTLEPAALDVSPLGACIKAALAGAKYPTAASEMQVTVPIKS